MSKEKLSIFVDAGSPENLPVGILQKLAAEYDLTIRVEGSVDHCVAMEAAITTALNPIKPGFLYGVNGMSALNIAEKAKPADAAFKLHDYGRRNNSTSIVPIVDGIIQHQYVDASDDPGAYAADQCGRQAVTAAWAYEHLVDETLYVYLTDDAHGEGGLDPWLTIDGGMDKLTDQETYVLCYGRTGEMKVDPKFRVFASSKAVVRAIGRSFRKPGGE